MGIYEQMRAELARKHLLDFIKMTYLGNYEAGWFQHELCAHLEQFLRDIVAGNNPRLMIFSPPRAGKSECVSRRFPAWAFGKYPDLSMIATSHTADLAARMNRDVQRIIDDENYSKIFPDTNLNGKQIRTVGKGSYLRNSDMFEIVNRRGSYKASGVGGAITGMGGNCLLAGTEINTDKGLVYIENLKSCVGSCNVLSFNHEEGCCEWKRLENWKSRKTDGVYRITLASGRMVEATGNHQIFTANRGYITADSIAPGDTCLCTLRENLPKTRLRSCKKFEKKDEELFLFQNLQQWLFCSECQKMQNLWGINWRQTFGVLQNTQACSEKGYWQDKNISPRSNYMPDVQYCFYGSLDGEWKQNSLPSVLLQKMFGSWSFSIYEWSGKSQMEGWDDTFATTTSFSESLSDYEKTCFDSRQQFLCKLWHNGCKNRSSSYRWEPYKQLCIEPSDALFMLSPYCSQTSAIYDDVRAIEKLCEPASVYDIQVADNHNFFANDILVHNCLLIDDPVKDAEQAYSATYREKLWEWYTSTLFTRCQPGGGILLVNTRWHSDDLSGRLLEQMKKGEGEQWKVVSFPAIAEHDEYSIIDGRLLRKGGDALQPERYPLSQLNRIKKVTEHSGVWASLYQQRPAAAEGAIFKRASWKWWKPIRPMWGLNESERHEMLRQLGIFEVIQSWDIAVGGKQNNDYTACTTLGMSQNKYYVLEVWKAQCEYPEAKRQVQVLYDKWRPNRVTVEGGGATGGKVIIQELQRETRIPFKETKTSKDKAMRGKLISPSHEAGLCYLPEGEPWVADFYESVSTFPAGAHDDDVDSWIMSMEEVTQGKRKMEISDTALHLFGI